MKQLIEKIKTIISRIKTYFNDKKIEHILTYLNKKVDKINDYIDKITKSANDKAKGE